MCCFFQCAKHTRATDRFPVCVWGHMEETWRNAESVRKCHIHGLCPHVSTDCAIWVTLSTTMYHQSARTLGVPWISQKLRWSRKSLQAHHGSGFRVSVLSRPNMSSIDCLLCTDSERHRKMGFTELGWSWSRFDSPDDSHRFKVCKQRNTAKQFVTSSDSESLVGDHPQMKRTRSGWHYSDDLRDGRGD